MTSSNRRLLGRLTLGAIIVAVVAVAGFFGWRATHRPEFQSQQSSVDSIKPEPVSEQTATSNAEAAPPSRPKLVLESPDAIIISKNLAALPKDLLAIPLLKDVVTEDLVNYYEDNADRLGIKGALKRIAFEHDLTWSDQLLESILSKPAEVALWRAANGKLDYFALVIERHPLEQVLESLAKVALSDAQLQQAGSFNVEKQQVPLYALRYMPRKTLFFAAYKDKLLVVSDASLILGRDDQPEPGNAALYADWLSKESIPQTAFHLKEDTDATQQIAVKANYLSFGYQRLFPSLQAAKFRYDGTRWSSELASNEANWNVDGRVWSGMPAESSACSVIPFDAKAVNRMVGKLLNNVDEAKALLASVQPPIAMCWFDNSRLYTPLIVAALKPGTRAELEPLLEKSFTDLIGMQELNLMTDDGSVQDARFNVSALEWDTSVKVWQRPVGSEYGLLKAKNFDQPDSLANTRYFKPTLMVSDNYVAFSPDADLVQQALKTWLKRYPAQADTFDKPSNVLVSFNPKQLGFLLQKETFSSLPKNYESIFRSAAEKHLIPKLEAMASQKAWVAEVDSVAQTVDGWTWRKVNWMERAQ